MSVPVLQPRAFTSALGTSQSQAGLWLVLGVPPVLPVRNATPAPYVGQEFPDTTRQDPWWQLFDNPF